MRVREDIGMAAAVLAALLAAGCQEIAGIHDRPAGTGDVCGIDFGGACGQCVQEQCCPALAACSLSPGCHAIEECLAAAGPDPESRASCTMYESGIADETSLAAAVDACIASQCSTACGLTCGSLYQITEPAAADACQACIVSQGGCEAAQACANSADCQTYLHCRQSCVTGDCVGACNLSNNTGRDQEQAFHAAADGACRSACEIGSNWSCVGKVTWPAPKAPGQSLTVSLADLISRVGIGAGVTVKLCNFGDPDCLSPINGQVEKTDATGSVTLLSVADVDFQGDLGLNGYLDVSATDLTLPPVVPSLVYWGFPLVEKQAVITTPVPIMSPNDNVIIYAVAGVTQDPARGTVGIAVVDCLGIQGRGVSLEATGSGVDAATQIRYLQDDSMTLSPNGPTQSTGSALLLNVLPGTVTITATPISLGRPSSTITVQVRAANSYTDAALVPTP
jgi:hypothetical protein